MSADYDEQGLLALSAETSVSAAISATAEQPGRAQQRASAAVADIVDLDQAAPCKTC